MLRKFCCEGKFTLRKFLAVQNRFGVWIVFGSHSDREGEYNNFTERVGLRITLFVTKTIMEVVTGHRENGMNFWGDICREKEK